MATAKKAPPKKADAPAPAGNTLGMASGYDSAAAAKREQEYQTSSDVRTLHDAHQIKKDPERMGRVKKHVMGLLTAVRTPGIPKTPKVNQMAGNAGDAAGPDSELPQP